MKLSNWLNVIVDQSDRMIVDDRDGGSLEVGDWNMEQPVSYSTGGYIGEGHDPIDLSNQNLNI